MPEAPEIKRYTIGLDRLTKNKILNSIVILNGPYLYSDKPRYEKFRQQISQYTPREIKGVRRKGKFMYFLFRGKGNIRALGVHHGMDGSWCKNPTRRNIVLEMNFTDGVRIFFRDSKMFGTFSFMTEIELSSKLNRLGPDVFCIEDYPSFQERIRSIPRIQNYQVCEMMTDQRVFSGIGNYLRSEILYRSKLHPKRKIYSLSNSEICTLFTSIYLTLRDVYDDRYYKYVVYGQLKCPEGHDVETFQDKKKRTVWWVPSIQN